jgi:hypothetical protein
MSEPPKRYQMWCSFSHGHQLMEKEDGGLIFAADYDAIKAENERLRAEVDDLSHADMTVTRMAWEHERFKAALKEIADFNADCGGCCVRDVAVKALQV